MLSRPVTLVVFRAYSQKESSPRLKQNLKRAVDGDSEVFEDAKPRSRTTRERKARAQKAQTMMDFGFVLRPYMKEYFSNVNNLLQSTPNYLEEREIVGAFLGLSSLKQLENGYTVGQIVDKNLEKKRPAYAMHLCRMAKTQGTVGMNRLLQYLCDTDDFKHVFKVYNNLKKWGVPPNERTYSILTHAGVNADCRTYRTNIKILLQIYKDAMAKATSNTSKAIYTNSTLVSLCRFSLPQNAYEFYMQIPSTGRFSRDEITYSTMLNLVARQKNFSDFPELQNLNKIIWDEVNSRVAKKELKFTPRLIDSYCNSLCNRNFTNPYFEVDDLYHKHFNFNDSTIFDKKFPFTEVQLDILLKSCLYSRKYEQAVEIYHSLNNMPNVYLDLSCVHNFLRNFAFVPMLDFQVPRTLLDRMVKCGRSKGGKMKLTSLSIKLFWRAFQQSNSFDINVVDEMRDKVIPDFHIPVDDHIISEYASLYAHAALSNNPPSSQQLLYACKFLHDNISIISNVSKTQPNPLRIDRGLSKGIIMCRCALDDQANYEALKNGDLKWLVELCEKLKGLQIQLKETFKDNPVFKSALENKKSNESMIFHEKQKEMLRRYRKVIQNHEIHIAKSSMKNLKSVLKNHAMRTVAPNSNELKEHEVLEVS